MLNGYIATPGVFFHAGRTQCFSSQQFSADHHLAKEHLNPCSVGTDFPWFLEVNTRSERCAKRCLIPGLELRLLQPRAVPLGLPEGLGGVSQA